MTDDASVPTRTQRFKLLELYHIYDASGTVAGEILYHVKKMMGASCSACDISHLKTGEKPEFAKWRSEFPVPVQTLHRDELDVALYARTEEYPCSMAKVRAEDHSIHYICVMSRAMLDICGASVSTFVQKLEKSLADLNIDVEKRKRRRTTDTGETCTMVRPNEKTARIERDPTSVAASALLAPAAKSEDERSESVGTESDDPSEKCGRPSDAVVPAIRVGR